MPKTKSKIPRTKAIPNRVGVRRRMPSSAFAVPETHDYPIPDAYHASSPSRHSCAWWDGTE